MWPNVTINQLNQLQGETADIERVVLFVGKGATNTGKTLPVNTQTNFDALLGADDPVLKSQVIAAMNNGGQNWAAYVWVLAEDAEPLEWVKAVEKSQMAASVEGIVVCVDAMDKAQINAAATLRNTLLAKYGRWVWFVLSVEGPQADEAWADYVTRLATLQNGISASAVQLVPRLWGNEPGVLAGRLCNRAVTIADSPARVKTGALLDMGRDDLPLDGEGQPLELATLQALEKLRYSVPMWYPDYDGFYWADGRTLDVEGGDYQVIEYLRIADKVARRVRLLAIARIADRSMNTTPGSIAATQQNFAKPLREMSQSVQINGIRFPGEVKTPLDGDVTVSWKTASKVEIYIVMRPVESPKEITVGLVLDTSINKSEVAA
ncbi:DUF2586 domain-containing protein [Mixta mediterraneensis]|uniref:DUF2586 domain-containing protein n=1 Tax=Mixta mediterraneensis TaxID=2758443 RepID=UPI001875B80E|nr:DUF2586 domain-containing protein [Mixta mediterraneensis]MBE5254168.1 DUF2586 family protein [Mixta mediterraneensis]